MINATVIGYKKDTTKTMRTRLQVFIKSNDTLLKNANTIDAVGFPVYTAICFDDSADKNYETLRDKVKTEKGNVKMYGSFGQNNTFWLEDIVC